MSTRNDVHLCTYAVVVKWSEYVAGLVGDDTQEQAAKKFGASAPTVSRWLSGQKPSAATAVAAARAYGDSPLNALVAVGFITAEEARQRPVAQPSLDGITDDALIELVAKRIKERGGEHVRSAATKKAGTSRRLQIANEPEVPPTGVAALDDEQDQPGASEPGEA